MLAFLGLDKGQDAAAVEEKERGHALQELVRRKSKGMELKNQLTAWSQRLVTINSFFVWILPKYLKFSFFRIKV